MSASTRSRLRETESSSRLNFYTPHRKFPTPQLSTKNRLLLAKLGFRRSEITDFQNCLIYQKLHVIWNCIRTHRDPYYLSGGLDLFLDEDAGGGDNSMSGPAEHQQISRVSSSAAGGLAGAKKRAKDRAGNTRLQDSIGAGENGRQFAGPRGIGDAGLLPLAPLVSEDVVAMKKFAIAKMVEEQNEELLSRTFDLTILIMDKFWSSFSSLKYLKLMFAN